MRLRTAPGAALATFALVMVTAFLAAALPRDVDRYEDTAVRHAVASASPRDRSVSLTDDYDPGADPGAPSVLDPGFSDSVEHTFLTQLRPPLRVLADQVVHGARTGAESAVPDPELPRTSPHAPAADLVAQAGLASHVRVMAGRLPHGVPAGQQSADLEAAITQRTAQVLHLAVGRTVHLQGKAATPVTVRISGILTPRDPGSLYWHEDTDLLGPTLSAPPAAPGDDPKTYWHFTLLVDRTAADSMPLLGQGATLYWHHPVDVPALAAHYVPALRRELASLDSGPAASALQRATAPGVRLTGGFGTVLDTFAAERTAASPLVLVAAVGVGTAALAVLLMTGGLAAERRRAELVLLRARGGSLLGIAARLAGETGAAAVPGAAIGVALALALLPTQRWALPVLLGLVAMAAGALALPLRGTWAVRRIRPPARQDLVVVRPSRRRLVLELTVAVLVAGAVAALRTRGTANGSDPFLAAAPALVAVAAALILLRVYPLPLRLLARPASRLNGAVTHLGLARAGRSPAAGQLPLLALLVSLTVASFGGSVLAGIGHGRDEAARVTVGADARIDGRFGLDPRLPGEARKVPGVGQVLAVRVEQNGPSGSFPVPYAVVIVDPTAYARLTHAIGLPALPAAALGGSVAGQAPLPAVVSPRIAAALGRSPAPLTTGVGTDDIRVAGVLPTTPATPGQDFVILSARQLNGRHPDLAPYVQYSGPSTLLAMNAPGRRIDGPALRGLARGSTTFASVLLRGEQRAALADSPLQHGAHEVYLTAIAAAACYSALALLLSLLQAAPSRTTLLARLRTMGMTRRQARRLVLLEMLPQALLAAVGGVLVGLAVIPLLRPGIDLRALAFGTGAAGAPAPVPAGFAPGLRADPWSLALPSAGLLVLACAVLLAQVWVSGRRRESKELRVGDRA
ncbi:ABC transporter permease [Streptomyces sp. KK5PA1]|uniref:ABC transporter permease n=2 Tax=Actinacidiphila acididurans TaxID=2784346 RepID=A0ABS2U033_9ACTN|nr:ABC transporter permease [Actinacidiphila acididurans]